MKTLLIGAALAVAAFLVMPAPAMAQQAVDPSEWHAPTNYAAEQNVGLARPAGDFETARLTSAPIAADQRDIGTRVDFTEIVASIFLGVMAIIGGILIKALKFLPAELQSLIHAFRMDTALQNGFNHWAEDNAAQIRTKGVSVDMRSDAIAKMVRYTEKFIGGVVDKNGGVQAMEDRAQARVDKYIDDLFTRWANQQSNLAKVATPLATVPPGPTERTAAAAAAPAAT